MKIIYILILPAFFFVHSCRSEQNGKKSAPESGNPKIATTFFRITEPAQNTSISPGSEMELRWEFTNNEVSFDSVQISMDGEIIKTLGSGIFQASVLIPEKKPGLASLRITFRMKDGNSENYTLRMKITSDIVPSTYTYKVINTYPHDIKAYTQGLEYSEGYLYEGTGNYGESSLRKVDLQTGEILKFRNLSSEFFGEGITRINRKIYQITYRERVGFVYDENTFEVLRKIYYQIKEGWGLTNNGEYILMSDGSHYIYFMDTTYFSEVKKIEVFDNEKEVNLLNELELINGVLYANRYTTNEIVMIDPETGKLLGRVDMSGILDTADKHPKIDYFNGIAYDKDNNRIFVTGKYWPKIYEVRFVEK